jgi:hypothetical protein
MKNLKICSYQKLVELYQLLEMICPQFPLVLVQSHCGPLWINLHPHFVVAARNNLMNPWLTLELLPDVLRSSLEEATGVRVQKGSGRRKDTEP